MQGYTMVYELTKFGFVNLHEFKKTMHWDPVWRLQEENKEQNELILKIHCIIV